MTAPSAPGLDDANTAPVRRPAGPWREAHAHLGLLGESLGTPSVENCSSVEACLDVVRREASAGRAGGWIRLAGARTEAWSTPRWPTREELDAAAGGAPCVVRSFDHHHAVANTPALSASGLWDAPAGSAPALACGGGVLVERDSAGVPTGLLRESAAKQAWDAAPAPTPGERVGFVRAALRHLESLGCVEVHDLHTPGWMLDAVAELDRRGELGMPLRLYPPVAELQQAHARRASFESARVRLAGGKVFTDGTLNGRTAHMIHRYALPLPDLPRGQCMVAPAALDEAVRLADNLGLHLAFHAIGDGAVRTVLDSLDRVRPSAKGWRIEHAEIVDAMDVPRFKALGVTCSVQPCHLLTDIEALDRYLPHRLPRVLPLREFIDSGLKLGAMGDDGEPGLVFGSDVPIVRAEPADSLQAAVRRRRVGAPPEAMIAPKQAISEAEAWACFRPSGVR